MEETFLKNLKPDQLAIIIAVLVYVTRETAQFFARTIFNTKDKTVENTQALREVNISINHLNERLIITEKKIDELNDLQKIVWKLEKDVDFAHTRIREIRQP